MNAQRSTVMTLMAGLNVAFGGMGTLALGLMLPLSLFVLAFGTLGGTGGLASTGRLPAAGVQMFMASSFGLMGAIGLLAGGIGVLKGAPWALKVSMRGGLLVAATNIALMAMMGRTDAGSMLAVIYGLLLAYLCVTPQWKAAMARPPVVTIVQEPVESVSVRPL